MTKNRFEVPTIYVAFGITGDLFKRKILKSIYNLYLKNKLPNKFIVYGFSRRDWSSTDLREYLLKIMETENYEHKEKHTAFLKRFFYFKGSFDNLESFNTLQSAVGLVDSKWQFCSNKIFHLAVPPTYYKELIQNLKKSGLTKPCSKEEGWTRILIEKPFGKSLKTAQSLENTLSKYFKEEQIYRIDHYLGKEELQNILFFRFSNNLYESSWNNKFIDKIIIKVLEKNKVDTRGNFYDGVGELRDMGQSHLLQMLSLIIMQNPSVLSGPQVRINRTQVLKSLPRLTQAQIKNNTVRAQYKGYKNAIGISKTSKTETYFKLKFKLKNKGFENIPVILESGKAVSKKDINTIKVIYKHPNPCFCPNSTCHKYKNKVEFNIKPKNSIIIENWYKKPGLEFGVQKKVLQIPLDGKGANAYEKLIYDCIKGDQTLFVSSNEVSAMWKFIDPILKLWESNSVPLKTYKVGFKP